MNTILKEIDLILIENKRIKKCFKRMFRVKIITKIKYCKKSKGCA